MFDQPECRLLVHIVYSIISTQQYDQLKKPNHNNKIVMLCYLCDHLHLVTSFNSTDSSNKSFLVFSNPIPEVERIGSVEEENGANQS